MAQIDLMLDDKKAQAWVNEVNSELELVENLISQVEAFMDVIEEESDPIMVILKNAGQKVKTYGGLIKKAFTEASEGLKGTLETLLRTQSDLLEKGADYVSKTGAN